MPADKTINYVEFPGQNFDQLEAFYSRSFGWEFMDYGPEYRAFTGGPVDGGFYQSELVSSPATGAALVVLYAADLPTLRDQIVANGGKISQDIFSFPGGSRFHFLDPHGNELAVWSE